MLAGEFKDGIKHGLWQTLNQIGEPIMIGHFEEGKKHENLNNGTMTVINDIES